MKKEKVLMIAIDAGFSGCKMRINGLKVNIPFVVQDITGHEDEYKLKKIDDSFIKCRLGDESFLIGEAARTALLSQQTRKELASLMEEWYSMGKFKTKLFEQSLSFFIAYAMWFYAENTKNSDNPFLLVDAEDYELIVGIALPHDKLDEYTPLMNEYLRGFNPQQVQELGDREKLKKVHELDIAVGERDPEHVKFTISKTITNSQLLCVIVNESYDDKGDILNDSIYDHLPVIVIDAGYKTLGNCMFSEDEVIKQAESNTEYAMNNINEKVAELIRTESNNPNLCQGFTVDEFEKRKRKLRYKNDKNKTIEIDVAVKKQEELAKTADKLINYLYDKYEQFLPYNMIIVAGGTGEKYYPYIKDFCKKESEFIVVKKAGTETAYGATCESVFAVVTGLYKGMLDLIAQNDSELYERILAQTGLNK